MSLIEAANKYLEIGWVLTPIPFKSKAPKKTGWNNPTGWVDTKAKAMADFKHQANMGVVLGPSKLCVIDVDNLNFTKIIFEEYGFDYEKLLSECPRIRGAKSNRDKAIFRYPEGKEIEFHKLTWGSGKEEQTVFELRCGNVQDVLPPSIHPEGHAYEWVKDPFHGIPEMPQEILNLWVYFDKLEAQLKELCPFAKPSPKLKQAPREGHENIIGQFNAVSDIEAVLESFGYKRRGKRFISPSSKSGMPGVAVFKDGNTPRCVSKHGDELNDGHAHDAFDVFRILKHGKDFTAAVKDAAKILGIKFEPAKTKEQKGNSIQQHIDVCGEMDEMFRDIEDQRAGNRVTIDFPWKMLSEKSRALRPGTVCLMAGPSKAGKSYFIMNLVLHLHNQGIKWKYLPLEDSRKDWLWRALAIMASDYDMTDDRAATADKRELAFIKYSGRLEEIMKNVFQNPRVGFKDQNGNTVIPSLPYGKILSWVQENARHNRILVLDPFAQIDFTGKNMYDEQGILMRGILGSVADSNCTLIINMHTTKGQADKPLSLDSVQGAADLVRLSHTTLLLDAHEFKDSVVTNGAGGNNEIVTHNRTLVIGATRNGSGSRQRFAFTQAISEPKFSEHGLMVIRKENQR